MDAVTIAMIAGLMLVAAALYSSVGHGGASAYLAIMALFSVAPETMRPTALALNLIAAAFGTWRFWRPARPIAAFSSCLPFQRYPPPSLVAGSAFPRKFTGP